MHCCFVWTYEVVEPLSKVSVSCGGWNFATAVPDCWDCGCWPKLVVAEPPNNPPGVLVVPVCPKSEVCWACAGFEENKEVDGCCGWPNPNPAGLAAPNVEFCWAPNNDDDPVVLVVPKMEVCCCCCGCCPKPKKFRNYEIWAECDRKINLTSKTLLLSRVCGSK